jgi:UMF1 family MFS transporter
MYDWAISALQTTTMVAVFPIYFVEIAKADLPGSRATAALATANTIVAVLLALASPVLGAISDVAAAKKRMLAASMAVGVLACAGMFLIHHGDWRLASALFVIALVGGTASVVFYEALLPHIASNEEIDRVSTAGYAMGYVGGGVLLALNLAWILQPAMFGMPAGPGLTESQATLPTRLALHSVAAWLLLI